MHLTLKSMSYFRIDSKILTSKESTGDADHSEVHITSENRQKKNSEAVVYGKLEASCHKELLRTGPPIKFGAILSTLWQLLVVAVLELSKNNGIKKVFFRQFF